MIALRYEGEGKGATAVLTLQRPERGNALDAPLVEALIGAVESCIADAALHTLVIEGEGADFCTGFDLGLLDAGNDVEAAAIDAALLTRFVRVEHLLSMLWHAPFRTVAVAHGRAFGAGADLFAACDLRLATASAQWRFPGAAFGIVLGTRRLGEQVGVARALDWVGTGRVLDTQVAQQHGLVTSLVDRETWRDRLPALAVGRDTYAALRAASRVDKRDHDMAALVRSAMTPGLARRITDYRKGLMRQRARPQSGVGNEPND